MIIVNLSFRKTQNNLLINLKFTFMKAKIVLLGLAILLAGLSNLSAQWYIGGDVTVYGSNSDTKVENNSNTSENKQSQLNLSPKIGYFVSDNFMVGLGLNIGSRKNESNYNSTSDYIYIDEYNSNYLSVEPFVRYYMPLSEKLSFINHFGLSYGFSNSYSSNYQDNSGYKYYSEGKGNEIALGYAPGISFNLTEKFLIELGIGSIGYSHSKSESTPKTENTDTGVVDEGDLQTTTSGDYYMVYNNVRLGLAFKF